MHQFHLEVPLEIKLNDYVDTFVSNTTDLGVETGIAAFQVKLESVFPPWINRSPVVSGLDPELSGSDSVSASVTASAFMREGLQVYGMQHCVHNVTKDLHALLLYWPTFKKSLTTFQRLLQFKERRMRFQWTCIRRTAYEAQSWKLDGWSKTLYEARWREIVNFLKRLVVILPLFRACWNHQRYLLGVDSAGDKESFEEPEAGDAGEHFDPLMLTQIIKDAMFHRYCIFVIKVDELPEKHLASWADGCACHEELYKLGPQVTAHRNQRRLSSNDDGMRSYQRSKLITAHFGPGVSKCPCAGCRADELADGRLATILTEAWGDLDSEIFEGAGSGLHPLNGASLP